MRNLFETTQEKSKKISIEDVLKCRITDETEINELEAIISFQDSVFCAKNEMSFISGKPKAGKTSVASVMLACCLTPNPTFDTLGMKGKYCEGKPIIYIDSEQSRRSSKKILERIKRLLNTDKSPSNLFLYNFRHLSFEELKKCFELLLSHHKGSFLWFLDGISDMVKSVNNEEEAKTLIHYLNSKVETEKTAFILFLHENSTSSNDKMRGHLGSEAQRKCFATISISKDRKTQIHSIKSVECRETRNFDEVLFRFDEATKSMITLQGAEYEKAKKELETERIEDLWDTASVLKPNEKVNNKTLCERIELYKGWKRTSIMKAIKEMVQFGIIEKEEKSKNEVYYFLRTPNSENICNSETP
ncbi:MAG: hypothetical protein ACK40K_00330 [Raineya sp.]